MHDNFGTVGAISKRRYKVRGIRDGILLSFDLSQEIDVCMHNRYVMDATKEAVEQFKNLLGNYCVVAIEGCLLGETERVALETMLSQTLERDVQIRMRQAEKTRQVNAHKTHVGTLRGGMLLQADGDVTIMGDVHAGAKVEAGGSIFVLGKLFGSACAGLTNTVNAIVCAWQLDAMEIRIADRVWEKSGVRREKVSYPECAYIDKNIIKIKKYNDRT